MSKRGKQMKKKKTRAVKAWAVINKKGAFRGVPRNKTNAKIWAELDNHFKYKNNPSFITPCTITFEVPR